MNYMCRKCRSIFKAPWSTKFPDTCPACTPKRRKPTTHNPNPTPGSGTPAKGPSQRPKKARKDG